MTATLPSIPILDKVKILDEFDKRQRKYQDRDAWYEKLMAYYTGDNEATGGLPILGMNPQGRPLLRPIGESINSRRTYSSQRLAPIIDDYAALLGRMPSARVEEPDPSEQGEQRAELLTKFLYSTYELSRMSFQQAQAGFWLSALGDAVYVLEPDPDKLRVVWNVCSPRQCWPSFFHGYRRFDIYDLMIADIWSPEDLEKQLKVKVESNRPEHCTVITYLSPFQRSVVVGLKRPVLAAHVEWDLDFCPAVWVFNKVTGLMGMSDIASSLNQQDFLDFCYNVWADGIVHMTYPMVGVKNPVNMGQDAITIGPGAPPLVLQGDGDIIVRNTQGDPRALAQIIQQTLSDINTATGTSELRQEGQIHASIQTGRLAHALQGPQSTRIEFKQKVLGGAIQQANAYTLALQEKAPYLRSFRGNIFGSYQGVSFQTSFDASKDIGGWTRNQVAWESMVGMNLQQKASVAYEGMVAKLWDDLEARRMVGVEDPIGMRKRIESQMLADGNLQAKIASPASSPEGSPGGGAGNMQGAAPAAPGAGGEPGGGQPATQPPPLLFRPPGLGQPQAQPPGGQPQGATQASVKAALQKLADNLRGTVWATGELATQGQTNKLQLLISDSRDYNLVLGAARSMDPKATVRQRAESKLPEDAVRLV